jgi:uncharacterized membrane protein YkvI
MRSMSVPRFLLLCLLSLAVVSSAACAAVAGIFKAGFWVGVILAVLVVGGGLVLVSRLR